jgi:quercetin dioxygenase-like cupin family protein
MTVKRNKDQNLVGLPFNLERLLNYQTNSVVSREIIRNSSGTMTIFAFDKDQGLSEHTAPFDAIVYILDGEAKVSISNKASIVKKHQMIIMPAGKPHSLKAVKKFKMLLILIKEIFESSL